MSYFMSKGQINQAAAGVGALPPQAAAGFGALPPQAAAGLGHLDAPMPMVTAWHDGVLGDRMPSPPRSSRLTAYRDGVFSALGALGAASDVPTYDLSDAEALKQFKLVLNYVVSDPDSRAISDAAIDTAAYGEETEAAFKKWVAGRADASSLQQTVGGHVVPTAAGLLQLIANGISASTASSGGNYAGTYWPMPVAYYNAALAFGPGTALVPPNFDSTGREGSLQTSTLIMGGTAAALVVGAVVLMRKKKRR